MLLLSLLLGSVAHAAPILLWITADVTPAARTAMIERLGRETGFSVKHLEYPLRGAATLNAAEGKALNDALHDAAGVWIDAPHPTIAARLKGLLNQALQAQGPSSSGASGASRLAERAVWILGTEAEAPPITAPSTVRPALSQRIATYLQAGGETNARHALTLMSTALTGEPVPDLPPARAWPARGLYYPGAPGLFRNVEALEEWRQRQTSQSPVQLRTLPAVAVLVHRYHFINGATGWLDRWLHEFARQGIFAYAVFSQQADAASLASLLEMPVAGSDSNGGRHLHPRVIVTHQLLTQGSALQSQFERWGAPVLLTQPYRQGDGAAWERDEAGLAQTDVPFYLSQPEAAGAIDPLVVAAQADQGRRTELIERQAQAVIAKARRLITLQTKPAASKQLVAMVYNYPPGGSNFGASFLNVPRSLEQVSAKLAEAGYATSAVPEAQWIAQIKPLLSAYYPGAALASLLENDWAAGLPLARYEAWWSTLPAPVRQRIEAQWGQPARSRYVISYRGEAVFVIPRIKVGNLSVLPQPPREETLNAGQSPFMHRNKTPLSHHYLATYLWAQQADALIHFGTHGTQEWAPGKARGLDTMDDALLPLGDLPVIYPYIVDNLGEALTAKRRGRAVLVSHRTPVFAPAGFAARMARMHELMHEWETVDPGPTKQALERQLTAQFVEHKLHRDLGWSAERIEREFAPFLELLHPYLDQLAQSSQPKGLAVFGRAPDPAQRRQTILQILRKPLIDALGEDIDEAFLIDHTTVAVARPARWLEVALSDAPAASRLDLRPPEPDGPVPNRAARKPINSTALLKLALRAQALDKLLAMEGEMPGLLASLNGRFIPAAYGGDPVRNPDSLPTGRNLTGLDPSRLPTRQAYEVAQTLFNDWLKMWRAGHGGQTPGRLALSLWAGETLRHQGVMEAQALVALGVQPVWDEAGRPGSIRVLSRNELGRPRVDVLLSVTGSYRDQFPALMALIDQAVAAVATAEPDNAVVRNTALVEAALRQRGVSNAQAQTLARARVFGNVAGDYGTGISDAVQSDGIQTGDARLGELFLGRMSQPYVNGAPLAGVPAGVAAQALGAHLRQTDAAVLSRSSNLYAMVTSDDPFQYLGGLAAAARAAGKTTPLHLYVSQLHDISEAATETAARSIALEMQSRYLHPGWIRAQQEEGYAGTLQVLKAVQFAWGWQVTAPDTVRDDHWQSFYEVLVQDKHQLGVPDWLRTHPQAYAQSLERLIQAERLGYWKPDLETRQQLAGLYKSLTQNEPLSRELGVVRQWVEKMLGPAAPAKPAGAAAPQSNVSPAPARSQPMAETRPPVQGVLLRRMPEVINTVVDEATAFFKMIVFLCIALLLAGGAVSQLRMARRRS